MRIAPSLHPVVKPVGGFVAVGVKRTRSPSRTIFFAPYTVFTATPGQTSSTRGAARPRPGASIVK